MADEPENLTLKLLREMRAEQVAMREDISSLRGDMQEVRAEQHALASLLGKVSDAVTAIAITQNHHGQVLERHSAILERPSPLLEKISETQANQGARLNAIDGRLALIEKHTGLVKA